MKPFRMSPRRWFWSLTVGVGCWLLIATRWVEGGGMTNFGLQDKVAAPLTPVAACLTWVQGRFDRLAHDPREGETLDAVALADENEKLRAQMVSLVARVERLEGVLKEHKLLKGMDLTDKRLLPAAVVGSSLSVAVDTCMIDRGAKDGVVPGALVESAFAPLGKVISTGMLNSTVRLLTDTHESMRINARLVRPRANGGFTVIVASCQVRGVGDGMLRCDSISVLTEPPLKGDLLLVMDDGWRAFEGWPIGEVVEVARSASAQLRYDLKIRPRVRAGPSLNLWVVLP